MTWTAEERAVARASTQQERAAQGVSVQCSNEILDRAVAIARPAVEKRRSKGDGPGAQPEPIENASSNRRRKAG